MTCPRGPEQWSIGGEVGEVYFGWERARFPSSARVAGDGFAVLFPSARAQPGVLVGVGGVVDRYSVLADGALGFGCASAVVPDVASTTWMIGDGQQGAEHTGQLGGEQHGDEHGERVELDRGSEDQPLQQVVLQLLVEDEEDDSDDAPRVAPTRGIRSASATNNAIRPANPASLIFKTA